MGRCVAVVPHARSWGPGVTHDPGDYEWQTRYCHYPGFRNTSHNNRADTLKGSYYANPIVDVPSVPPQLREEYPEYYGSNICRFSHLCPMNGVQF